MNHFDEWFDLTYPSPQPPGTRQSALIAWNAAVRAAHESVRGVITRLVEQKQYEHAALARDIAEEVRELTRIADAQ